MNIIQRLFRGGTVEPEAEVENATGNFDVKRYIDAANADDVLAELANEKQAQEKAQAEAIARERRETAEYRARVTAQATKLRGRLNKSLDELGDLVPRLLLACSHFNTIAAEVQVKGLGFEGGGLLEDHFCIPPDFGSKLIAAIKEISPRTEWDYGHIGILGKGKKAERPKLKGPQMIRTPRFAGDAARTYDANKGPWPPEKPIDGEGTSGMFLPFPNV
jgi:hypothetical protein